MLSRPEARVQKSLEVALLPENDVCKDVENIVKAKMAKGCSLLCCLNVGGQLLVSDVSERGSLVHTLEDSYTDFFWEVLTERSNTDTNPRLLTVGPEGELRLHEVGQESQLSHLSEYPTHRLLQLVKEKDPSASKLTCAKLLLFTDGRCFLLLNTCVLVQLQYLEGSAEPETVSSCLINLPPEIRETCTDYQLCRGTLFVLTSAGLIYVFDSVEGKHLATVDLPVYYTSGQREVELVISLSSFCLLNISQDLSTAVAATSKNQALALDLNDYFRTHPDQLLCQQSPSLLPLMPTKPCDQDSITSSAYSQSVLGTHFQTDHSWEAKLVLLYKRAKAPEPPALRLPWYRDIPNSECRQMAATAKLSQPSVPAGGILTSFVVPEQTTPAMLNVSEFSAVLTFTSAGNSCTTLAHWDLESQNVTYHCVDAPAAPVQRSEEEHLSLILKASGLSLVLFAVSQEELLNRLMVFGSAGVADSLCHLNAWGRCSMPIHALQAGLKNRQLDMVDFFLKSKENILCPPTGYSMHEQAAASSTQMQLKNAQDLCPALDLLHSAIKDTYAEAQSPQFCEQLLNITLNFLNTQIRVILSSTPELDVNLQECVKILNGYISELRTYMRKYPWLVGGDQIPAPKPSPDMTLEDEWESMSVEEVVKCAVLCSEIPRAQAYLRRRSCPEQKLEELRTTGLNLTFSCLTQRDLQQATALLTNMGFNVKEQLHKICMYTADRDLRAFMVEELKRQNHLSTEEMEKVEFIKQIEQFCLTPATRCLNPLDKNRVLQISQSEAESRCLLQEMHGPLHSSFQSLLGSVRLDWVRHWDNDTQRTVLLSRLPRPLLGSCDSAVLWSYLTSLHDQTRVTAWLTSMATQDRENTAAPQWPALTAAIVNGNTLCSDYMRDQILDMLARQEVFVQSEMSDFEQLLWRVSQAGGVMRANSVPPVPQFHVSQGQDFHTRFIQHCLENSLHYLLYTYLEHYRLTPSNCPAIGDRGLYESYPWFEMMVKLQRITRDLTDPERVFQASLTSAQVLLPGSQASVSSMLLEGHSLLALSTIMFGPGGIDQVVREGDKSQDILCRVDPQLLRMALSAYPKLKAALFPHSGPRGTSACDISIYQLMQSLHPLDPSKLFGWQSANTLGTAETSTEFPHFSSPHLVNKYALIENLDFLYYLQHGRPSFAYGIFIIHHLANSKNVKLQISLAVEQVYALGLLNFNSPSVATACVCFCELLGVCSQKLRVDIKALNLILKLWSQNCEENSLVSLKQSLVEKVNKLVAAEKQTAEELLLHLEGAIRDSVERRCISRSSYEAGQEWALPVQFCHLHGLPLSAGYLRDCASDGQWLNFLLFVQIHHYPPQQVRSLVTSFSPALQAHLFLAFQDLQLVHSQQGLEGQRDSLCPLSTEESSESPKDLFQVLLQSQEKTSPWRHLLAEAVEQHCPPLTVLAACHQDAELLQCLCVWILTSVDDDIAQEATVHINENPAHHTWNLHDLSVLWKTLLRKCKIRPLIRGFQLFQRESPLIHMLQMFELCYDYKNYEGAKDKLLEFQKCLLNLRSSGSVMGLECLPVQWVESQASVLLLILMQQCGTQYELRRLLQLLADMERLLKSNGPDFKKLSQLSQILAETPVCLSPCLLEDYTPENLQRECQSMLEELQELGLFSQARRVAELAGLPIDRLIVNELLRDLEVQKGKRQWERQDTRLAFWRRCHEQFRTDCIGAEAACQFFLSQAEEPLQKDTELLHVQERCLLLGLAGHWLSQCSSHAAVERMAHLEKQQWQCRVRRLVLTTAMEQESLFAPAAGVEDSFNSLLKEYSFSKMAVLNNPAHLSLDTLPSSEERCLLVGEECKALTTLIGQLLDEGNIHEASRVCRYFGLYHKDLRLVLQCEGLACGELQPGLQELPSPDAESRSSLPSCSSTGSLSSFVVVSSPEDQVLSQLQLLVEQCRHGKSYCKQVLSLYELSKELRCSYVEISSEEPEAVLRKVLLSHQPERYKKAQAFISVQGFKPDTVAQLISSTVLDGLLASSQEGETAERCIYSPSEGREAFLQLAKLCGDPNLVGNKLLDSIPTVPLAELGCTVELLILAHDCFSLTCNMEGIVKVLQAARHLSHTHLAHGEGYGLLVRLLTGIGRYNEMTYVFDLLNQNHRFEMLLRKKVESNTRLKTALLDYLKRCLPGDSEKHNMVALCFSMRREIGENHEGAARTQLKLIESQPWAVTPELKSGLEKVLFLLKDAAESYSKDSCMRQALRCVKLAKLITLQLHFLNHGQDHRVVNLRPAELLSAVVALPRCYQSFVVAEAYDYSPDWAEVLYQKVILRGEFSYLEEFKLHRQLSASLFEEISKKLLLNKPPNSASQNLKKLLQHCEDIYTRYKLAYEHNFIDVANMLLQDSKTNSYLNDRLST
ncbi:LOW QUALITY PROTEIN: spatacsin [Colossoma macropomum]|uniref:LOW QUALITY PROTEIN: spatacsin n=1 Tax=Colossoma macropomum TaxID=42526 RepID=UPI001864AE56|nr:LOW QUALITY PROTEIN: spatacsin [Colossoma macropomum]